ncbi:MAG: thiamine-phosphate kinase [Candidatus Altiarchaeota archaeon]
MKISSIGEHKAVENILKILNISSEDAAVIKFNKCYAVLSTDMLYERTDILEEMSFEQIGKLAVTVSLSDIAAMGAKPLAFLLSYGGPDIELKSFYKIIRGVKKQCKKFNVLYAGGDTNKTNELVLSGTAFGITKKPILRSGAKISDIVCVTGNLGTAALAIEISKRKLKIPHRKKILKKALEPEPRVFEGLTLAKYANSMIDISDSLALSLHEIAKQSNLGIEINIENLPTDEYAKKTSEKLKFDITKLALYGGGDYELLFTISEKNLQKIKNKFKFTVIGKVVNGNSVVGIKNEKRLKIEKFGYEHFSRKRNIFIHLK